MVDEAGTPKFVQIEIDIKKLEFLFNQGHLCVADLHCLNGDSKRCVWELCLSSCSKRMQCHFTGVEHYSDHDEHLIEMECKRACRGVIKPEQIIKITR